MKPGRDRGGSQIRTGWEVFQTLAGLLAKIEAT
jgi:hypothetical protein